MYNKKLSQVSSLRALAVLTPRGLSKYSIFNLFFLPYSIVLYISNPGNKGCPSLKSAEKTGATKNLNKRNLKWKIESLTE